MEKKIISGLILIMLFLSSCNLQRNKGKSGSSLKQISEQQVKEIKIEHPFLELDPEISGLAWYKNYLILLPQYPNRFMDGGGYLFYISKNEILNYLSTQNPEPLKLRTIKFRDKGLEEYSSLGSGYEAVSFNDEDVYLNIESIDNHKTSGILVKGKIDFQKKLIQVNADKITKIKSQSGLHNFSDEANLFYRDKIYSIHEANGIGANSHPHVKIFDESLEQTGSISFPNIEYRITDATEPDSSGKFYALNYLYLGDINKLKPAEDSIAIKYGIGISNNPQRGIERIIQFQILEDKIIFGDQLPVYLELSENGRNWEGIAELEGKGFLVVTDKHPETILAFVSRE